MRVLRNHDQFLNAVQEGTWEVSFERIFNIGEQIRIQIFLPSRSVALNKVEIRERYSSEALRLSFREHDLELHMHCFSAMHVLYGDFDLLADKIKSLPAIYAREKIAAIKNLETLALKNRLKENYKNSLILGGFFQEFSKDSTLDSQDDLGIHSFRSTYTNRQKALVTLFKDLPQLEFEEGVSLRFQSNSWEVISKNPWYLTRFLRSFEGGKHKGDVHHLLWREENDIPT